MFPICQGLFIVYCHLTMSASYWASKTRWRPYLQRLFGVICYTFLMNTVFFARSLYLIVWKKLFSIFAIRRWFLTYHTFISNCSKVIFTIWWIWSNKFIYIFLLIKIFIRIWALCFSISKLQVVFIKWAVRHCIVFLWTRSAINAFNALLLWIIMLIVIVLFIQGLSFPLTDVCESKYVTIGIKESKWRILFVLKKLNLQYFSVQIDGPTELLLFILFDRIFH